MNRFRHWGAVAGCLVGGLVGPLGIPFGLGIGLLLDYANREQSRWQRIELFFRDTARLSNADMLTVGCMVLADAAEKHGDVSSRDAIRQWIGNTLNRRSLQFSSQVEEYLRVFDYSAMYSTVAERMDTVLSDWQLKDLAAIFGCPGVCSVREMLDSIRGGSRHERADSKVDTLPLTIAYRILGVSPRASDRQVKSAYRKLAVQFHPDGAAGFDSNRQEWASGAFQRIHRAYQSVVASRRSMRAPIDESRSTRFS